MSPLLAHRCMSRLHEQSMALAAFDGSSILKRLVVCRVEI